MTTLLALTCCLLVWFLINQVHKNRRLKKLAVSLYTRLDRQNEALLKASAGRPAEVPAPKAEPAPAEAPEDPPATAAPATAGPPDTRRPVPSRQPALPSSPPPAPSRCRRRRRLNPNWPTFTALLILGLAAGFLFWFGLTLGRFSPALRLGAVLLAGLASLTLGLLTWEKHPKLGLTLEGYGLGLIGLTLVGAAWLPNLLAPGPGRAALIGLGLFAAILALKQNSPGLTVLVPPAFFSLWSALNPGWTSLTLAATGAGIFYLVIHLAAGRSTLSARRLWPWLALASFNLALVSRLFNAPPENISPWTCLSLIWILESVILVHLGRTRPGALGLGLAGLAVLFIPDRFSGVSQSFLAASVLGGALLHAAAKSPRAKPTLVALGLICWLAASLALVWGSAAAQAEPFFILNRLLVIWSLFSLVLWLAGRLAPNLLTSRRSGSLPLLVLAQVLPLAPALILALSFLQPFLGVEFTGGGLGELDPSAWLLWSLAQGLGLAQARRLTGLGPAGLTTAAWSNAVIFTLALTLSQAAAALVQTGPDFGQDMTRLAAVLGVLALCARPPRLAIFQELSLCRVAGGVLAGLALWRALTLALDPADRPGFFGFLPVLNMTDLAQAAAFWLPAAFLRRLTAPNRPPALDLLQRLLFFLWLNVVLARAVHHLTGLPYQFGAIFGSTNFWLVSAVVWGGLGLGAGLKGIRRQFLPGRRKFRPAVFTPPFKSSY
jgi:hypothetical protein